MTRSLFKSALVAVTLLLSGTVMGVAPANAVIVNWAGSGASGADPFGHTWGMDANTWEMPGMPFGNTIWEGPGHLKAFHITFDREVSSGILNKTPFGAATIWDEMIMGNEIWFTAPSGDYLDVGENFLVRINFSAPPVTEVLFTAQYLIPEPGTLALFGLGLAGLGFARRRKAA